MKFSDNVNRQFNYNGINEFFKSRMIQNFTKKKVIKYFLGGPILSFVGQTLQNFSKYIYYIFKNKNKIWGAMALTSLHLVPPLQLPIPTHIFFFYHFQFLPFFFTLFIQLLGLKDYFLTLNLSH